MFNALNNILGIKQSRHAEQNDTRQHIQRHDPDFERRRQKKREDDKSLDNPNNATIAVDALITFLNKFLKELSDKPQKSFNQTSNLEKPEPQKPIDNTPAKTNKKAAQAANAYQDIANNQKKTSMFEDVSDENADLLTLDASEIRIIHELLKDLKELSEQNVEYIRIERASSFLQSLVNAVSAIKNKTP